MYQQYLEEQYFKIVYQSGEADYSLISKAQNKGEMCYKSGVLSRNHKIS